MKKISSSFLTLSLLMAFGSASHASNLNQTDPVADLIQSSTAYFQQECHLYGPEKDVSSNCNYYVLNLAKVSIDERSALTSELLGFGVDSKYVLVTKPNDIDNRGIYLLDVLDPEYIASSLEKELSKSSRSKRSASRNSSNVMEQIVHRRFNVEREGKGNVTLKYKIRFYSKSPFYASSGDKDKHVEIILAEGAGVDTGLGWKDHRYSWKNGRTTNYIYSEYLDAIDVGIKINDSENLSSGQVYLVDLFPRMQDQVESNIEKETTTSISVGLSDIPKLPIKEVSYSFTDKYSISNKKQFELFTQTNQDGYNIQYVNAKYGSAITPAENGFCQLGTADGWCWDYDVAGGQPWDFDKLRQNNSLAISGMRPDFVAKIAAKEDTDGTSDFVVSTTVDTLALFGHNRFLIGNRYVSGPQLRENSPLNPNWHTETNYEKLTYIDQFTITVDWNSPWFLGANAVTIKSNYLSQQNAQCLTVVGHSSLQFKDCVDGSASQSFIYDEEKRYRSVANINQCLDSANGQLTLSSDCRHDFAPNTQTWNWQAPNDFANDVLYTRNYNGTINAIDASTSVPRVFVLDSSEEKPASVLYTSRFTDFGTVKP
ncbi:RICIN domain-containing protein [Salinivibrio sp. IB643]|uniref:RICIN domain-containing protein n=1 Tax=Salinivibrio sp. IB643 TaxID=1909445 RepID=UPI00098946B5|nr:RICIN domain-containing protein [Salinivibrio sp. IB643]OOE96591.1 hypothetical protein BZG77_11440 [Salinivibrio sp. IB643]